MASQEANWEIGLGVALDQQGTNAAIKALNVIQDLISDLAEKGNLSEKSVKNLTNRIQDLSGSLNKLQKDTSGATTTLKDLEKAAKSTADGADDGFKKLSARVSDLNQDLQEAAQLLAGDGLRPDLDSQMDWAGFKPEDLQEVQRYYDTLEAGARQAANTFAQSESQRVKAAQDANREIAASRERYADLERQTEMKRLRDAIQSRHEEAQARERQNDVNWAYADSQAETGRAAELAGLKQQILSRHTEDATKAVQEQTTSLPTLRYALYDVAQTAGIVSASITALGTGLVVAAAQYETAFTAVERTSGVTGEAVGQLRDDLIGLSREIPQTFAEISNIAARGAQLGVANDQLDTFTDTVAKFVATSDTVSLDQAVEAFGRISNLLGDTDFNRIGSAITLVGVNAAATEAQIVKTTQELAPFATAVGMSTEGVIALATALGSLGQPPERARSAFLTLQRVMDNAIADGSENLNEFARLLGMTADQTANLWKQDPDAFVTAFARSLGSVEDLTTAFADLGINERRAVQVFQALAADARNAGGELSVLERAMSDSAQGYAEGTELARQYGLIVDDLASKWQLFQNAVMELSATLGSTFAPALKSVLDALTSVVQGLADFASTPVGRVLTVIAGAVAAVAAAFAGLIATLALTMASMAGVTTVLKALGVESLRSLASLQGLRTAFGTVSAGANVASGSLARFAGAARAVTRSMGLIGVALAVGGAAWDEYNRQTRTATEVAQDLFGSLDGIEQALREDTEAVERGADSYFEFNTRAKEAEEGVDEFALTLDHTRSVLGLTSQSVEGVTENLKEQTLHWGQATQEAAKYALFQSEMFRELAANDAFRQYLDRLGVDMDKFLTLAAYEGAEAAMAYISGLEMALLQSGDIEGLKLVGEALKDGIDIHDGLEEVAKGMEGIRVEMETTAAAMDILGLSAQDLGDDFEDAGASADVFRQDIDAIMGSVFDGVNAMYALNDSLFALGEEFYQSGAAAAFSGDTMQQAIQNVMISSGDMPTAAANLQVLYDFILANTAATASDLIFLAQTISQVQAATGGKVSAPTFTMPDFSSFTRGMSRAASSARSVGRAAKGASKEVREELRTVLDWANDLSKVWNRAFDLRFGVQNAKDATADFLQGLRDDAQKARDSIKTIRTEIQGIRADLAGIDADISQTQYFLSIALEFGDTKRAEQLQAQLTKLEADRVKTTDDLTGAQKDLKTEQESLNRTTQGNSQAARDNRQTLQDLYKTYQDQLQAYAESGVSQSELSRKSEELRAEFVRQATQLGYNRTDLKNYEAAFYDVSTAIRNVPRNVNVEIRGLSASQAALREFEASTRKHVNNARNSARGGVNIPVTTSFNPAGLDRAKREIDNLSRLHVAAQFSIKAINQGRELGWGYASGGYTGRGGKYEPAGVVHRGEYVIPKHMVNQSTGLPYADAYSRLAGATQAPTPRGYVSGGFVQSRPSYGEVVNLSAKTIQALAHAVKPYVQIGDRMVGESAARSNARESYSGAY